MSSHLFHLEKHIIPAAHIRGLPRGVKNDQSGHLRLAVNHYIPKSNPRPVAGDLTFILAHGISSAKECYEPFFEDLLTFAEGSGLRIRGIWLPDAVHNCESYLLNKDVLGDAIHWLDFSRDLWQVVNHFQAEMPEPVIGVGQSLGVGTITLLSSWHPRLFAGILAFEPGLGPQKGLKWPLPNKYFPGVVSARRKDRWSSRDEAAKHLRKSIYYKPFDARVFERVVKYELKNVPGVEEGEVTLTMPKTVETYSWVVPLPPLKGTPEPREKGVDRQATEVVPGYYRPEAAELYRTLPFVLPPVLLVWGSKSAISPAKKRKYQRDLIGSGEGGGGGVASGQVKEAEVQGATHPVSLEKPKLCAEVAGKWLVELQQTLDKERESRKDQLPFIDGFHEEWLERLSKL